jgi:hypothetical protein
VVADDAFKRAIRESTPQHRAILVCAERWRDPQWIRELRETEVGKRCRGGRQTKLRNCSHSRYWRDVRCDVRQGTKLSKDLDTTLFGSRAAPTGSMNRDRKTSQCSDPQERTRTGRCGMVNRVQIEHGAKEPSLTGDRLQPRARVSSWLPNSHEKAPVNKNLTRSPIARIPECNIECLVRGRYDRRDDRRNPASSGSDRARTEIVSRCQIAFRIRELRVRIDRSRQSNQTRPIELLDLLDLLFQVLVEFGYDSQIDTTRNDPPIANQEISNARIRFVAEEDSTDNSGGHGETVPRPGKVSGRSTRNPDKEALI